MIPVLRQREGYLILGTAEFTAGIGEETEQVVGKGGDADSGRETADDAGQFYQQIQTERYAVGYPRYKYIITITGVVSDTDWFNNSYEAGR